MQIQQQNDIQNLKDQYSHKIDNLISQNQDSFQDCDSINLNQFNEFKKIGIKILNDDDIIPYKNISLKVLDLDPLNIKIYPDRTNLKYQILIQLIANLKIYNFITDCHFKLDLLIKHFRKISFSDDQLNLINEMIIKLNILHDIEQIQGIYQSIKQVSFLNLKMEEEGVGTLFLKLKQMFNVQNELNENQSDSLYKLNKFMKNQLIIKERIAQLKIDTLDAHVFRSIIASEIIVQDKINDHSVQSLKSKNLQNALIKEMKNIEKEAENLNLRKNILFLSELDGIIEIKTNRMKKLCVDFYNFTHIQDSLMKHDEFFDIFDFELKALISFSKNSINAMKLQFSQQNLLTSVKNKFIKLKSIEDSVSIFQFKLNNLMNEHKNIESLNSSDSKRDTAQYESQILKLKEQNSIIIMDAGKLGRELDELTLKKQKTQQILVDRAQAIIKSKYQGIKFLMLVLSLIILQYQWRLVRWILPNQ